MKKGVKNIYCKIYFYVESFPNLRKNIYNFSMTVILANPRISKKFLTLRKFRKLSSSVVRHMFYSDIVNISGGMIFYSKFFLFLYGKF